MILKMVIKLLFLLVKKQQKIKITKQEVQQKEDGDFLMDLHLTKL